MAQINQVSRETEAFHAAADEGVRVSTTVRGEAALTASYLKHYLRLRDEMWSSVGSVLDIFAHDRKRKGRVIDSAKTVFRCYHAWRYVRALD